MGEAPRVLGTFRSLIWVVVYTYLIIYWAVHLRFMPFGICQFYFKKMKVWVKVRNIVKDVKRKKFLRKKAACA